MEHSHKRVLGMLVLMLITAFLFYSIGQANRSQAQDAEKSLDIERYPNEPFSLIDLKVSEQSIKSKIALKQRRGEEGLDNVRFKEREDWFKRVWIRLRNTSNKPISGVQAYLYFKVPGAPMQFRVGLEASTSLKRGVVEPGDEVDLKVSDQRWSYTADMLRQHGADVNLAAVTLSIERVWFTKDLQWTKGHLIRRDAYNPNKWNVIDDSSQESPPGLSRLNQPVELTLTAFRSDSGQLAGSWGKSAFHHSNPRTLTPGPIQANAHCQVYGGEILDHCSMFGCFTRTELGGAAGTKSSVTVADICVEENPNIDDPTINCTDQTVHNILQEDPLLRGPNADPDTPSMSGIL